MRDHELPEVRRLPLFRNMLAENFESLMRASYAQTFPAQLEMVRQGDPADLLHIVVEGAVELFSEWNGHQSTMAVVRPVGSFILAACIKDQPYLMSARTMARTRIILVPASDIRSVFRRDMEFAVSCMNELAGCYRAVVRHAKALKLRNSHERIAAYLYRQSRYAGDVATFTLTVEKRLLASYLGMTAENLSRALKALEADGVKVDGSRVIITDREKLKAIARPDYLIDGPDWDGSTSGVALPFPRNEEG
ncbi:MAG: helix-turn-helix domain-containing protein [Rhodobacteraceae bacterium]|jgi:CRP/FNR family transcriptional activator FtrB|nr:helix-turn-helix domain-containing protein [Paracoccaceae bacterium]